MHLKPSSVAAAHLIQTKSPSYTIENRDRQGSI
jgi:hypothetical protein